MLLPEQIDFEGPFPCLSRRLRLGVVGGGRIAGMQAMAARLTDRWEVVAGAFSSDPVRAKSAAAEWYLPQDRCYASFAEMATREAARPDGVDAVMITTPNHLHFDSARAFLEAGIDVLCDKPLTNDLAEADALVELVQSTGCIFGVSYVMSCFPMIRQAREIVSRGGIGKINQIHVEFMQDWMTPDDFADAPHVKWRLDPAKSGRTSCVGDIGTHAAHLAAFASDLALTDLRAEFHVCGAPKPLEDTFFAWTKHAGEIPGTLMATRLAPGNRGGLRLRIFGSEGGLEWDLEECDRLKFNQFGAPDQIISRGHGHGVSPQVERLVLSARGFPEGVIEAWGNLYTEFAMAVAARRDGLELSPRYLGLPRVAAGRDGVRLIDACVRSNEARGAWVEIT
ncbi:Gfo/Idh/MocA family protein [Boseongicola aestuarii]|uniref:Glucose--fructose oxidoreductase n=1 Tax=Boseongicola aestuarii TaxID=1470561 RepID=A0A238J525_9RHOB|nr:Gfo/Idh/MocA family oxidoreductase [Boseongicola aestuarii]SMX25463.1 Glucose--fructose oxidoreductase precursor [Boseongicola aestuarii]